MAAYKSKKLELNWIIPVRRQLQWQTIYVASRRCNLVRASNVFMFEFLTVENQNLEDDKFFYADKMDTRNYLFTGTVVRARKDIVVRARKKAASGGLGEADFLTGKVAVNWSLRWFTVVSIQAYSV